MKFAMRRLIALAVTLAVAPAVSAFGGATAGNLEAAAAGRTQQTRVPGEYLVTVAARDSVKSIVDLYGQFGIKGIQDHGHNIFLVTLTEDPGPARMEQLRGENAHVRAVQPNFAYGARGSAR